MTVNVTRAELLTLGDITIVPLTQDKIAIIDADDAQKILQHYWHAQQRHGLWYAIRRDYGNGRRILVSMHRAILQLPPEYHVDHCDGDGLNNRRANLRIADGSVNRANSRKQQGTTSRYKGVSWHKCNATWCAEIRDNYQKRFLGYFRREEDAARAYDKAAREIFGNYVALNFAEPNERSCLR